MCKQNNIKKHQGFTLVELLVTIAILAVLATVSVVGYTQYIEKSAVTTDNFLVKQLNDFTKLYEIEHSGDLEDADIRNLLKNAGLESIELKSEGYEYRLYFDKNNQEFVLATEKKDNYILIDDEFLSVIDSTPNNGNEGTAGEGGDENIQAPGDGNTDDTGSSDGSDDTDNTEEPKEPEIVEPNLVLQNFGKIPANYNKPYIFAKDNVVHIGVSIESFGATAEVKTDLSKIKVTEVLSDGSSKFWTIKKYELEGLDITKNISNYMFSDVGYQELTLTIVDPDNIGIEKTYICKLIVRNVHLDDAIIDTSKMKCTATIILNSDNTYSYSIPVMDGIIIYTQVLPNKNNDYATDLYYNWNLNEEINNITKKESLNKTKITITVNGVEYLIDNTQLTVEHKNNNKNYDYYYAVIGDFTSNTIPENSYITYYYQGGNGVWVASDPVYIS